MRHFQQASVAAVLLWLLSGCNREQPQSSQEPVMTAQAKVDEAAPAEATPPAEQPTSPADTPEACSAVGEGRFDAPGAGDCAGTWNVYASIPDGWVWYDDKMGTDPQAQQIEQQAIKFKSALEACGITAHLSVSDWFSTFTPGLLVVHSNPFASKAQADEELKKARACGIRGYAKNARYQLAGGD